MTLPTGHLVVDIGPGGNPADPTTWPAKWKDITEDLRQVPVESSGVTITGGRSDEAGRVSPSTCAFQVDNRDGNYSPQNPLGTYYPLLGQNTPVRVRWDELPVEARGLEVTSGTAGWVAQNGTTLTTSTSQFRTGARSLRVQLAGSSAQGARYPNLAADGPKCVPGQVIRFSAFIAHAGSSRSVTLRFTWYTVGGSQITTSTSSGVSDSGSFSNNTRIEYFATAPATADHYTVQILYTGGSAGEFHYFDDVELGTDLFIGFVSEWPQRWDTSGNDSWANVRADGPLRRLGQLNKPLESAATRHAQGQTLVPLGLWPLSDDSTARTGINLTEGGGDMFPRTVTGSGVVVNSDVRFGSSGHPVGASGAATIPEDWFLSGRPFVDYDGTNLVPGWTLDAWIDFGAAGDLVTAQLQVFSLGYSGSAMEHMSVDLTQDDYGGSRWLGDGTQSGIWAGVGATEAWPDGDISGLHHIAITADDTGGGAVYKIYLDGTQIDTVTFGSETNMHNIRQVRVDNIAAGTDSFDVSQVVLWPDTLSAAEVEDRYQAGLGFPGETAVDRMIRLCAEHDVPFDYHGTAADSMPMGPQQPQTFLSLLYEAETADGGALCEQEGGICYRTRVDRYSQEPALTLDTDNGEVAPPLEPIQDDRFLVNEATVNATYGGGGDVYIDEENQNGSLFAPARGRYDTTVGINYDTDSQAPLDIASWIVHLGTTPELRWPLISVRLQKNPELIPSWLLLMHKLGQRMLVDHSISQLPSIDIDVLVEGYVQRLNAVQWEVSMNCIPAAPWEVFETESDDFGRFDTESSQLVGLHNSSTTSLSVATNTGPLWVTTATHAADFPFDIMVGGERMTVTAISGTSSPQTFTVTRSVNGIVKSHNDDTPVKLYQRAVVAL